MATSQKQTESIAGISSMATRHVLAELADAYARRSGPVVTVESAGGVEIVRRIQAGDPFDFVVLAAEAIDALAAAGHVVGRRVDLARSGVAIAVPAGAPHPDVSDEAAVREAVLRARSVGYSTGPSGVHLKRLFERWGIAEAIAPRVVQAPPGVPVGSLVARGQVGLGFQQLSELMHLEGIDVIGPLPPEIQAVTVFSGAVCKSSAHREGTQAVLAFFASPEAGEAKRRHGMEPA